MSRGGKALNIFNERAYFLDFGTNTAFSMPIAILHELQFYFK